MFKKICASVLVGVFAFVGFGFLGVVNEARADWCMLGQDPSDPNCIKWGRDSSNSSESTQYQGSSRGTNSSSGRSQPTRTVIVDRFGAVALDRHTGFFASSRNQDSKLAAEQNAIETCNSSHCEIVGFYSNMCMSFVSGELVGGVAYSSFATSTTIRQAEKKAMQSCNKKAKNCQILLAECSIYGQ